MPKAKISRLKDTRGNERVKDGHWERGLMLGKRNTGAILVIVDRKNKLTLLQKVKDTRASTVNKATCKAFSNKEMKIKTLTNDNGHEFGEFWNLEKKIKVPVYFTHPLCPWERGSVENTIGLLRQYIPKGTNLKGITHKDIKWLENEINSRPRKSLGFKTPYEVIKNKTKKLIKRKRFEPLPLEYYEQFY